MPIRHTTPAPDQPHTPTIALLPWGNVVEDFLDTIGISLETFCTTFTGSWLFGYADALRQAGVRTVIICFSAQVVAPMRYVHAPTGATVCVLPASKIYRVLRRSMHNPYGRTISHVFGERRGARRLLLPVLAVLREIVLYLATPPLTLARALRREACDVIVCQEYEYPRFDACALVGQLLHMPVFGVFQGGDYQRSRIERFVRPLSLRACAGLIIAPRTEIQRVRSRYNLPLAKVARIFNPIDVTMWRGGDHDTARAALEIPPGAQVVVWHGRVSIHKKGLDLLLAAWEQLCRERPDRDLRLLLVGTGHDSDELQRRITALGLPDVRWLNQFVHKRSAIRDYLVAGDVYAFPSRHEGFAVAPLEAMACGLALVASDASGVPDILEDGAASGGLIVPCGDATALALAIGRVLDDEAWCHELGNRAKRRAAAYFSLDTVGAQLRSVLFAEPASN